MMSSSKCVAFYELSDSHNMRSFLYCCSLREGERDGERDGQAEVLAQELKVHNGQGWARLQLGAKPQCWSLTWMARTPSLELLAPSVYLNRKLKLELNL